MAERKSRSLEKNQWRLRGLLSTINPTENTRPPALSNAIMFRCPITKPNIQLRQEIRIGSQVVASEENYWHLRIRLATINQDQELRYRPQSRSGFTSLKPNPIFNASSILGRKPSTCVERELLASKCSSFYHQSGLETLLPLSNALRFYSLKTKPNIQLTGNQEWKQISCVQREQLASKFSPFYHQSGLKTLLPRNRYRTPSGFTCSKQIQHSTLGTQTKQLRRKRTIGF